VHELSIGKVSLAFMGASVTSLLEAEAMSKPETDRKHQSYDEEQNVPGHVTHPPRVPSQAPVRGTQCPITV
jgi:hypothetical protein